MMMIFAFEQSLDYCGLSWDLSAGFLQPLSDQTSRLPSTIRPNLQAPTIIIRPPCRLPSTIIRPLCRLPSTIIRPNLQASFNHYPTKPPGFPQPLSDLPAGFPQLSNQTYLETSLQTSLYYLTKPTLRPPCRLPSTIQPNHPCPIVPLYLKILS